jgi:hypothetical protein
MPSVRAGAVEARRLRWSTILPGLVVFAVLTACGGRPALEPRAAVTTLADTTVPFPTATTVVAALTPRTSPAPSPSSTQSTLAGRPILYFGSEMIQGTRGFVTRAVYVNGHPWSPGLPASGAAWSPAGTRLAYIAAAHPETLQILIRTGAAQPVFEAREGERLAPWPAWAPDGIRTAVLVLPAAGSSSPVRVAVIVVPAAQLLSRQDLPAGTVGLPKRSKPLNAFHWSGNGQRILVAWEDAVVLDTRDGKVTPITPDFAVAEWAAAGDAVLYFKVEDAGLGGFYRQPLDGSPVVELVSREQVAALGLRLMEGSYGLMLLSPDRKRLAVALGTERPGVSAVRIYEAASCISGDPARPCPDLATPLVNFSTAGTIAALEWAPDGTALAAVAVLPDGVILQVLDLGTGLWRSPLPSAILQPDELPVLGYIRVLSWGG